MSTDSLSAPGAAIYSSQTMHVGDGTWDASKDTFLLPNIQGLNYQTLRYNGMGNRFSTIPEYHTLILGHGIVAATTFLGVVPAAILIAKFYHRNPHLALRLHISLQLFTVILATVVLVLGYFAVGPSRSLTNPHHGIGIAIYVLVIIQFIGGAVIHRVEKGKMRYFIPIKLMLHQWLGRAIALLAIAQIPIGLALYGSPIWLFILYALVVFALLVLYFILTYRRQRRQGLSYEGTESSFTDTNGSRLPPRSGIGGWAAPAAAGAGIAGLRSRFSGRHNDGQHENSHPQHNQMQSQSQYTEDEGSYVTEKEDHTWRNRFLGAVGGVGAYESARRFFGGRDDRTEMSENSSYNHRQHTRPHQQYSAPQMTPSALAMARVEEGMPPPPPQQHYHQQQQQYQQPQQYQQQERPDDWRRVEDMEAAQAAASQGQHQQHAPIYPQGMASEMSERPHRNGQAHAAYSQNSSNQNSSRSSEHDRPSGFMGKIAAAMGISSTLEQRNRRKREDEKAKKKQRQNEINRLSGNNEHQPLVRPSGFGHDGRTPNVMESPTRYQPSDGPGHGQVPFPDQNGYGNDPRFHMQEQPPPAGPARAPPTHHDFAYGPAPPPQMRPQPTTSGSPRVGSHASQRPSPRVNFAPGTAAGSPTPQPLVSQNVPLPPPAPHVQSAPESTTSQSTSVPPPLSLHVRHSPDHLHVRRLTAEEAAAERRARKAQAAAAQGLHQQNQAQVQSAPTETGPQVPAHTSPPPPHIMGGTIMSSPSAYGGTQGSNYEENRQRRRAERARVQQARQAGIIGNDGRIDYS